jgi:argininosuccinate synthase
MQPQPQPPKKIVLAYSGGLDTSVILPWLKERYPGVKLVAFAAELGQGDELKGIEDKAYKSGADEVVIMDLREEFAEKYCFPMLRAHAIYEQDYLLGTSIARPLIAAKQVEVAHQTGADAVGHGATGKGNDQVRFELTYMALDPKLKIIAPWKDPSFELRDRESAVEYAARHNVPIPVSKEKIYSQDRNLWHISHEGAEIEHPEKEPNWQKCLTMTVPPERAPDQAEVVEVEFRGGNPIAVNGKALKPGELIAELNKIGGRHGVGVALLVENRLVGMKSRGVYETPGGTVLLAAHRAIESITLDRGAAHLKDELMPRYAELIYNGFWFAPEREMLQALIDKSQEHVAGLVRLKLYKGNVIVTGRESDKSLYSTSLVTFEDDKGAYDQKDAEGFIRLNALRLRMLGMRRKKFDK